MASLEFCPECLNALHPEEDRKNKKLYLICKKCEHRADATEPMVYKSKMKTDSTTRLDLVDTDLARDPTLPRTFNTKCPECRGKEAVFFMSRSGKDSDMSLIFLCANDACLHKWLS